tara:strand:- start:39460 stop:40614 length:1155 start_codon:yes stop_codon:yes gene_type:complete
MTGIVFWNDNTDALDSLGSSVQLEFSYMLYSDIVQQVGEYDWQVVEELLNDVASRGHQAILRFRYTYPGHTEISVPDSIANSASYQIMVDKVEGKDTFLPDWSNSALQDFSLQFFADFAARYDGDPRLAMLQVGFGSYSEYHLYDGPVSLGVNFPSKTFQKSFLEKMSSSFNTTLWSISIDAANDLYTPLAANPSLLEANFGVFDDSFMHKTHSTNDTEYNSTSWLFFGADRYQSTMLGGEFSYYSGYDQQNVLNLPNGSWGRSFESFAEQYHISYIIGNDQYKYQSAQRIKQASLATGYKFNIDSFTASATQSRVTISNTGIAPIYYNAYPAINGTRSPLSLKGLLPGESLSFEFEEGGNSPVLSIESDHLVAGQDIEFSANL